MLTLLFLCFFMFIGCYVAGLIPLAFNYSPNSMRMVTIFGAGLLVGAALAIIIPEGVATIYAAPGAHVNHDHSQEGAHLSDRHLHQLDGAGAGANKELAAAAAALEERESHRHGENHGLIGLALTLGFVLMFLVDHLGAGACCNICLRPLLPIFRCVCCRRRSNDLLLPTTVDGGGSSSPGTSGSSAAAMAAVEHSAMTTTLGLVVHSLADGLAIGAAFGLTLDLTLILFIAIMLHKAPAAFGFVSFLLHEGLPRHRVRVYLLAFALASPVGALLTYLVISAQAYIAAHQALASGAVNSSATGTGFALLLSGGTFLYVATAHILPHLNVAEKPVAAVSSSVESGGVSGSSLHGGGHQGGMGFKPVESLVFVLGSCVPVLISFGHSH